MTQQHLDGYYEILQVHPAAPVDLVTAAYWRLVNEISDRDGSESDRRLHQLSRAYAVLTNQEAREAYDRAAGITEKELAPRVPHRKRSPLRLFVRSAARHGIDYYDVLRVHPDASHSIIDEAYETMHARYLHLVRTGQEPLRLLDAVEEAHEVLSDPKRRQEYDAARTTKRPAAGRREKVRTSRTSEARSAASTRNAGKIEKSTSRKKTTRSRTKVRPLAAAGKSAARKVVASARVIARGVGALRDATGKLIQPAPSRPGAPVASTPAQEPSEARLVWPEEEAALIARISESTGLAKRELRTRADGVVAHIVVSDGPAAGARFEISRWPVSVGASGESDIVLEGIAPQQVRLLARDGKVILYSLALTPPVLLNDEPVVSSEVDPADTIFLGPHGIRIERSE